MFEIGVMTFFGVHLIPFFSRLRVFFLYQFGETLYKALFSVLSIVGLFLLSFGYQSGSNFYYPINDTAYSYSEYVMFVAFPLIVASNMQTYIKKFLRHPMSLGIGIWAIMHLLVNPDFASTILFGSFLIYSIVSAFLSELRNSKTNVLKPKLGLDILAVVLGVFLASLAFNFHGNLTGVQLT